MKAHTSDFKNQIKEFGRELDSIITYTIDNEEIELGAEELNSITPHYEGAILKSVMKQLDIDSNIEIPVGTILNYQFGVKIDDEYEYIDYGNYVVYSVEKQEDTNSYKIICYDKMLYAMKEYETPYIDRDNNEKISYPITVGNYLDAICYHLGITLEESIFANNDKVINEELFLDNEGRSMDYTFRDVLDQIAEVTGGTICINKDDKLEVRYIQDVGELQTLVGSSIEIEEGEEAQLQNFELEGKTEQETRSGKNMLKLYASGSGSSNGINYTINSDGSITLSGTASSAFYLNLNNHAGYFGHFTNNEIYTSYLKNAGNYVRMNTRYNASSTSVNIYTSFGNECEAHTYNGTTNEDCFTYLTISNGTTITGSITVYPMIVKGNYTMETIGDYEPYGEMPSPDYPSELVSVGYENLFDKDSVTNGYYLNASGGLDANSNYCVSDFIPVISGEQYYIPVRGTTRTLYYLSDKTRYSNTWDVTDQAQVITIPNNVAYIRMSIAIAGGTAVDINTFQFEKGTQAHSYIPYGKYGIEVKTTGKNLFNKANPNLVNGYVNYNTGIFTAPSSNNQKCFYIKINSNTTYTWGGYNATSSVGYGLYSNIPVATNNANSWGQISASKTITTGASDNYLVMFYTALNTTVDLTQFQLEKNNEATEYEPYKENKNIYQLNEPLRSIGDTKDILYIKNGMLCVDRKIGSVVLDGSENWYKWETDTFYITKLSSTRNALSNYYKYNLTATGAGQLSNGEFFIHDSLNNNAVIFRNSNYTVVTDFKTWLSTHNTEVQYALDEPYTENLGEVQMPSTYDGVTHINANGVMNISYISEFEEIDEEYLKDVNVNFGEKYGPVNTIVLSRGGDGDKISTSIPEDLPDEDKVAIQITDNQIMNGNDRNEYMLGILNELYGLEYYINDFTSTGICYLDLCDRYKIKIGDTSYKCIMFNDEANITQGLTEIIYTDAPEEQQQEYKYMNSTDRGITQANIIAKKNEATITEYTQKFDDANNRLNAVETKQTETDRTINILGTNIDENGNITSVKVKEGFTFDENGFQIYTDDSSFKTLIDETGTYYYDGNTPVGAYTKDGSKQKDLQLFGVYYYGMDDIDDDAMFVAQLYTDENGEEGFGHFYNRGD